MLRPRHLLLLLPALLCACPEKDEPDDTTATTGATETSGPDTTGPTTGATDPTGTTATEATTEATGCVQADCSEMCAKNHDEPCHTPYAGTCMAGECVCEAQPDDCVPPLDEVECGMVTCTENQFCLQPGEDCDYNSDPPEFFTPAPKCEDVPSNCQDMSDAELVGCLGTEFCPTHNSDFTSFMAGKLECPSEAPDCFELTAQRTNSAPL